MIRLFTAQPFQKNELILLSAPQSHYLTHVMRLNEGEKIECFNGIDGDWEAVLQKNKKQWTLKLQQQTAPQQKRAKSLLCLALIKRDPLAYALQKATELGVSEIHLIQAERSNHERVNMDRLNAIVHEACEQCERNDIPTLFAPQSLSQKMTALSGTARLIWLSERGMTTPKGFSSSSLPPAFFIGPEGGWTDAEQALFEREKAFSWHLGDTILRAETAAVTALALWQYQDEIKKLAI